MEEKEIIWYKILLNKYGTTNGMLSGGVKIQHGERIFTTLKEVIR